MRHTLILSKTDGAIIRSTGLSSASQQNGAAESTQESYAGNPEKTQRTAEEVAKMAFNFVNAAGGFANRLEDGDDVQLLRLRTKKMELVIVPGEDHSIEIAFENDILKHG